MPVEAPRNLNKQPGPEPKFIKGDGAAVMEMSRPSASGPVSEKASATTGHLPKIEGIAFVPSNQDAKSSVGVDMKVNRGGTGTSCLSIWSCC